MIETFNTCRIKDGVYYQRPKPCISAGKGPRGDDLIFGTLGNLSLIKGAEKSGKSFFKSMIIAGALGGRSGRYVPTLQGHGLKDKIILEIDTEQDKSYVAWNRHRVLKMVGAESLSNYTTLALRDKTFADRMELLGWVFEESPVREKLGLVFIDGFVDLIGDFNSNQQSRELVEKLMIWSQQAHCHISGIIHTNPGDDNYKARGHLGTMLQQKCETVVVVSHEREGHESYHVAKCQRSRGFGFNDIKYEIDADGLPVETENVFNIADLA